MVSTRFGRDKVTASPRALRVLWVLLLAAACRPDPASPRGTAERFLDAYYVQIDLRAALPLTSGLARQKVEQSIALTQGQPIDATTRKPTVRYRLLEERPDGETAIHFVYLGRITVEGADDFERRWLVTVRRETDGWRVTNYQEPDG